MAAPVTLETRLKSMQSYIDTEEFKAIRKKYTTNMSRAERRDYQRREEKLIKCVRSLTPVQMDLIDQLSDMKAEQKFEETNLILDRCISALLSTLFEEKDWEEILEIEEMLTSLIIEDTEKTMNFKKEYKGDMEMANKKMEKYEKEVTAKVESLLGTDLKQKEIIDILVTQFPMLSKSMLTNAYKKMKSAYDKEHKQEEPVEDLETQEAAEKILGIIEEGEEDKEAEEILEKADEELKSAESVNTVNVKEIEEDKEMKAKEVVVNNATTESKLKVLEEKVVKTIKVSGENGEYEAETGKGVVLSRENASICFANEEQLEEFVSEFREVFAMIK